MICIEFGNGLVGVRTLLSTTPSVMLSELNHQHEIGSSFSAEDRQALVRLSFKNKKSLDILIDALEKGRECIIELPDELRLGA